MRKQRGRLTEPLVRENGTLRPASWDEALDFAAEVTRKGRVAVLIEGDNGIELNFSAIADAMDGNDKLAVARAVH